MNGPGVYAKAIGAGFSGAATFLLVWSLNKWANAGIDAEGATAVQTVLTTALVWLLPNTPMAK